MVRELTGEQLMEITEKYPWFAPARAALCRRALESSGIDAALSAFNSSMLYLPDSGFVASCLSRSADGAFKDSSIGEVRTGTTQTEGKPRMVLVGMDYFSREEYESVSDDSLKNLGKIAYFDNSGEQFPDTPAQSAPQASSGDDLVTETLALIYVEQGYYQEAAEIYRKLSLQSPEKSAYFASLIDNLKL